MADVAETSTLWSNVLPLYFGTVEAVKARFRQDDGKGYIGCHMNPGKLLPDFDASQKVDVVVGLSP